MPELSPDDLRNGYALVALAHTPELAIGKYGEFHQLLEESKPLVETIIEAASPQDETTLQQVKRVRNARLKQTQYSYFRGTGIIMAGDSLGKILIADYPVEERDMVADKYPGYQYMGLRKLALAALVGHLRLPNMPNRDSYLRIEEILSNLGLAEPGIPHHLGYAAEPHGRDFITAAASGVLPSFPLGLRLHRHFRAEIMEGRDKGWLEWPIDEAAGLHDQVAAQSLVIHMAQPNLFKTRGLSSFSRSLVELMPSDFKDVNIH